MKGIFKVWLNERYAQTFDEWKMMFLQLQDEVDVLIIGNNAGQKVGTFGYVYMFSNDGLILAPPDASLVGNLDMKQFSFGQIVPNIKKTAELTSQAEMLQSNDRHVYSQPGRGG